MYYKINPWLQSKKLIDIIVSKVGKKSQTKHVV